MKTSHALALLVLFAFAPLFAHATDITVDCTPPTKNTDGSNITGAITFNLYGALQGAPKVLLPPSPLATCHSVRQNVNPGTQCYEATAIVGGTESDHSAESCKNVAVPKPLPPGAPVLTLSTTSTVAYGLAPSNDRLAFLIVGSVPLGTACLPDQHANGFNVIPRATVTYDKPYTAKTVPTVLALCGA